MIDFTSGCCFFRGNLFVLCHHKPLSFSRYFSVLCCVFIFFSFYKIAAFVIEKPVTLVLQRNFTKNEMSGTLSSFLISQYFKIEKRRNNKIYDTKRTFGIFCQKPVINLFFFLVLFFFPGRIYVHGRTKWKRKRNMTGAHSMNIIIHV